jgi:hypothetical protein
LREQLKAAHCDSTRRHELAKENAFRNRKGRLP